ncbi:transcription elongation factor SPT6-like [Chelonus insularis]|uniref:transcription elongation factor SPT6-like n=1 Tax=Chelonus insularis TaxID=460826 RepID=UPI00158A05C6|nr:transcription elongation factor SPT6-like [Chelonus insularis]XP_034935227.1 transcription elongation factor SPT6-like [Chelonus insularis]
MADYFESETDESEQEEMHENNDEGINRRRKGKLKRAFEDSEEEEEDDEEKLRHEMQDLIDDNHFEESEGEDSDISDNPRKRKKSDDEDFDDRLEDDDYDLIEENLGITVERKRFRRLKRMKVVESDDNEEQRVSEEREAIANELFEEGSGDENKRRSERNHRKEPEVLEVEESEGEYSDSDDFIVDDDGRPVAERRRKKRAMFSDIALQEAQDIFGVDFDYDEFEQYEDEDYEEEEDQYVGEESQKSQRPKKQLKKNTTRKSIFDIYEPSELRRGHFTDIDNEIRNTDIPERMQLRSTPIIPVLEGSDELDDEAEWIYQQAFCRSKICSQDSFDDEVNNQSQKGPQTVAKIKKALDFMRNQNFEVPFISFYRKEYVNPELNINDLWKVYKFDAKWCQLKQRKENLLSLFEKMRSFQLDEILKNPDAPLPDSIRVIKEDDIDRVKNIQTEEELKDVHNHFRLYYSHEIPGLQEAIRKKEKEARKQEKIQKRRQQLLEAEENGEEVDFMEDVDLEEDESHETLKQAVRTGPYTICRKAGLDSFAKKFGLTPEDFAENLRDNYQRHEVDQEPIDPLTLAQSFIGKQLKTPEEILKAVQQMVAMQLAREPLVRKCMREMYMERAKLSVKPTKKGMKEIDENHSIYTMKYLKDKPIREFQQDQFLKLAMAEEDKLITIILSDVIEGHTSNNYIEEIKQLYIRDEFSKNVQDWNNLRIASLEMAINKMIIPNLKKELKSSLIAEAKEYVMQICCRKMFDWIKIAPFSVEFPEEVDAEWNTSKGIRVMAISYVPDYTQAAFTCIIAPDKECTDFLKLPHLLKRKNSFREHEKAMKEVDLLAIKNFILEKKPHVIVVGGESKEALIIVDEIKECLSELASEEQFPLIQVEIIDNDLAKVYANSSRGISEFKDYPELLRQAISLARRFQDPLLEFSQLCTPDNEILCLKFHPLQDQLPKDELLENLYIEFINRVNEVGVDLNKAVQQPYASNLLQFVCGLGPRKSQTLIKVLKQTNQRLENRTQLVTICHMGPKVFINCAGFIKIDTNSLGDSTEAYVEVLDGSRVHPETYEWARKMAVDALEYDDEDGNPAGALEEILETPEKLKDLDLDAFAEELERQGFGNKSITLYDIRAELTERYKELRTIYETPTPEKLFDILTKESTETFYIGKLILAEVISINYRTPDREQLDQANPVKNDESGLWQCPFCLKKDFPELSEVWNHFDAGTCPGKATGIRLRLDNGVSGYIHIKNLSDKHVKNPEERVTVGQSIHCRIIKIDVERFSVECTSKSSDLADKEHKWRPTKDSFYDTEEEQKDIKREEDIKKIKQRQTYVKRVIVHPSFYNISFGEAEKRMKTMKLGEVIIRPSSKGSDHLTVTWKVTEGIHQHIDIREEGKANAFSLGQSLWIGNEEFEDLDEVIARYVNPMAAYVSELLDYKYYETDVNGIKDKAEELLNEKKKQNPGGIPYIFSAAKDYPGKFLLSYLPRLECLHEYISVVPEGFKYRGQIFTRFDSLVKWFKEHFRDPIPIQTPKIQQSEMEDINSNIIQSMDQKLSYHYPPDTPGISGAFEYENTTSNSNTPYTPSAQTPYMTPYEASPHTPYNSDDNSRYQKKFRGRGRGRVSNPRGRGRGRSNIQNKRDWNNSANNAWSTGHTTTSNDWKNSINDAWPTGNTINSNADDAWPTGDSAGSNDWKKSADDAWSTGHTTTSNDWKNSADDTWSTSSTSSSRYRDRDKGCGRGRSSNFRGRGRERGRGRGREQDRGRGRGRGNTRNKTNWNNSAGDAWPTSSATNSNADDSWPTGNTIYSNIDDAWPTGDTATSNNWKNSANDDWPTGDPVGSNDWKNSTNDIWPTGNTINSNADDAWPTGETANSNDWKNSSSDDWPTGNSTTPKDPYNSPIYNDPRRPQRYGNERSRSNNRNRYSGRSPSDTPNTNSSPQSMLLGNDTPLYDEK